MLRVGQTAPGFTLPGAAGDNVDEHALAEYVDNGWHVVLVFYPFDFHPACVSQWCTIRDADRQVQFAWQGDTADAGPDFDAVEKATRCHDDECELSDESAEPVGD
ncbi:redoxin domain-containing protein [Salinigranum salinum]|uniref:redoxin domain-containing protein n=1 Tax=Salinigranum salinum TaxID=1364937 RepID=UPI001260C199|nr:redoxin domain-containing protein [Salinigranum salinum]